MDRVVYYVHPHTVIIKDGEISFLIPKFDFHVTVKVKGTKGKGVYDAKFLRGKAINHYHKDLLDMFLQPTEDLTKKWKSEEILSKMKIVKHLEDHMFKFNENNWRRPISEFVSEHIGILEHPPGNDQLYVLNVEKATKALETGKFD